MKLFLVKAAATAVAMSLAGAGVANADVTFNTIGVNAGAFADTNDPSGSQYDEEFKGSGADLLSVQAYATASSSSPGSNASSTENVTFNLSNAYSGLLDFIGTTAASNSANDAEAYAGGAPSYGYYSFSVGSPETLTVSYAFDGSNLYTDAENEGYISLYDSNNGGYTIDNLGYGSGTKAYKLSPSDFYSLEIDDYDDDNSLSQYGFPNSQSGSQNDTFSFSISAAPEPSAWALMIAGAAVAGFALRRRPAAAMAVG